MPRKRALGPLDQRRKVIRCEACAARKTRCAGGYPCEACIRTGKTCRKQSSGFSKAVFVLYKETEGTLMPAQVMANNETIFVDCFFAFLGRNHFVYHTEVLIEVLLPLVNKSTLLSAVISAIGALDASRHGSCSTYTKNGNPRALAYKSYASSIESLKTELLGSEVSRRDDVLWATFFLGLFELMVDSSGDGWAKHMLYGTSQLLQAAGPNQAISHSRKAFLGIFKIFEANRAILYSEETILSRLDWTSAYQMNAHIPLHDWDSLGPISSIMVQISTFNNRFFNYIPKVASFDIRDPILDHLGFEAFGIQRDLFELHGQITNSSLGDPRNLHFRQALPYYHATLLFLFNTFDYYGCWNLDYSPYLSRDDIGQHVDQILHQAGILLNSHGESGILLIFPLRVAGTRAETDDQRSAVLVLLDCIFKRGFIVVNRIKDDLHQFWDWKDRSGTFPGGL
ncbi:uncharacterized protein N7496_012150 [Penicillium cataractarum]|uniref:Zn(2)-C6 fungal-type domain-containing protein n=1 Tax=Penicillium cataractarum TaxID=2100454 RepID=A0A9W9RG96_9EURO|nr:uncharacterized protein N7496_012150 [Penicillium cataractarum]KAJ5359737.1 hypothetical protein N7496_012150 [Penicillium cataractarum]